MTGSQRWWFHFRRLGWLREMLYDCGPTGAVIGMGILLAMVREIKTVGGLFLATGIFFGLVGLMSLRFGRSADLNFVWLAPLTMRLYMWRLLVRRPLMIPALLLIPLFTGWGTAEKAGWVQGSLTAATVFVTAVHFMVCSQLQPAARNRLLLIRPGPTVTLLILGGIMLLLRFVPSVSDPVEGFMRAALNLLMLGGPLTVVPVFVCCPPLGLYMLMGSPAAGVSSALMAGWLLFVLVEGIVRVRRILAMDLNDLQRELLAPPEQPTDVAAGEAPLPQELTNPLHRVDYEDPTTLLARLYPFDLFRSYPGFGTLLLIAVAGFVSTTILRIPPFIGAGIGVSLASLGSVLALHHPLRSQIVLPIRKDEAVLHALRSAAADGIPWHLLAGLLIGLQTGPLVGVLAATVSACLQALAALSAMAFPGIERMISNREKLMMIACVTGPVLLIAAGFCLFNLGRSAYLVVLATAAVLLLWSLVLLARYLWRTKDAVTTPAAIPMDMD